MRRELAIAHGIQQSILPKSFPSRSDVELVAEMLPAKEVGGDFYDFFFLDEHRLGFLVGDVSGKGVPAAIYMALSRTLLKATAATGLAPDACLAQVNRLLCAESGSGLFVTVFYGILDTQSGVVSYCLGGHPAPYVIRANAQAHEVPGCDSPIVGVLARALYNPGTVTLAPGEALCVFSDGITEAMNASDELFGDERLQVWLSRAGGGALAEIVSGTVAEVRAFEGGAPQSDDLTMLVVRYNG